jgi:hypothetical protein
MAPTSTSTFPSLSPGWWTGASTTADGIARGSTARFARRSPPRRRRFPRSFQPYGRRQLAPRPERARPGLVRDRRRHRTTFSPGDPAGVTRAPVVGGIAPRASALGDDLGHQLEGTGELTEGPSPQLGHRSEEPDPLHLDLALILAGGGENLVDGLAHGQGNGAVRSGVRSGSSGPVLTSTESRYCPSTGAGPHRP